MVQLPDSSPEQTAPGVELKEVEAADDSVADWMEEGESAAVEKYFWVALLGLNGLLEGGPSSSLDVPSMAIQVAIMWLNTVDCADLLSDLAELMDPAATPTDVLAGSLRFVNFPDRLPTPPAVLAQYFGSKLERCNLFEDALRDDGSLRHHWQCISLDEGGGIRRTPCTVSLRGGLWGRTVPPQWLPDATACDEALRGPHHAAAVVSVDPVPPPRGGPHPVGLAQHHCQELWYSHLACRAASAMCMGGYHLAPGGWLTAEAGAGAAMWQLADCAEGPAILAVWYAAAEDTPMVLNFSAKKDHRQHVFPATGGWDVFVASGSLQMDLAPGWNQVILETVQGRGISIKEVIIQQPWKSAAFCYW